MNRNDKIALLILGGFASMFAATGMAKHMGYGLNIFGSGPVGVWQKKDFTEIERGMLITFCPPSTPAIKSLVAMRPTIQGDCPDTGSIEFIKAVGAVEGDTVTLRNGENVLINGHAMPNTVASPVIAFPPGEYKVNPGEVWAFSTYHEQSYDSRYYGPVPVERITGKAEPVLTYGEARNMSIGLSR